MAWGPDKALYVADLEAVRRVAPDGTVSTLTRSLFQPVPGDYSPRYPPSARGLAVDKDGSVYVVLSAFGRISKVTPDGEVSVAARFEDKWEPQGVAVHDGRIYATELKWNMIEYMGPRLRVFEKDGTSRVVADLAEIGNAERP